MNSGNVKFVDEANDMNPSLRQSYRSYLVPDVRKQYFKTYYTNNKDRWQTKECKEKSKAYYKENIKQRRAYRKLYYYKLKDRMFSALGGYVCNKCGYCDDKRALQIDHINGGGRKERSLLKSMVGFLIEIEKHPTKYQVLCANCNVTKRLENNEDPKRF